MIFMRKPMGKAIENENELKDKWISYPFLVRKKRLNVIIKAEMTTKLKHIHLGRA